MKKHIFTIFILIISAVFIYFNIEKPTLYRVVEVVNSEIYCVDFNSDLKCDPDEKIKLYGLTSFPEKFSSRSKYIEEEFQIREENSVILSILAKKYASDNILDKFVKVEILSDKENPKIAKIYLNGEDFAQNLLKNGWALAFADDYKVYENFSKIKKNISFSKSFNYQLRNNKNGKIHTLDCEYGRKSADYEIGIFDDEKYKKDYCNFCHKTNIPKIAEKPLNADYISNNISVYFTDFTNNLKPDTKCKQYGCKILLKNINVSKESIDFAIYGLGNVPEIEKALIDAKNRGVKIRYVVDEDENHNNIYEKTKNLKISLPGYKTDYIEGESSRFNSSIMHNKFFIFDNEKIWLGSANVSETDLSGFSANNIIFIKSKDLAKIYENEFEKMYNGYFHTRKKSDGVKTLNIDSTSVTAAFSPQDKIISNLIIPIINNAKKSIYIETFVFTNKNLADNLISTHKKGIDIKIIVDATNANSNYSMVKYLRQNGINVKVENYAGKMHMKTIIIDDDYFIAGSMNLSKSGENYNDENVLIIKNPQINSNARKFFKYLWGNIPDKYSTQFVRAESKYSIGSCFDGIDNNYDGKIDKDDDGCK